MSLSFRSLALVSAVLCFVLFTAWLIFPHLLLTLWGIEYSYPTGLVARRAAALFLGIGVMFLLARNAPPSPARQAFTTGLVVGCSALAALGIFELATGHAGPGILSAITVEIALALAFLATMRTSRQTD